MQQPHLSAGLQQQSGVHMLPEQERKPKNLATSILKWVTMKELVFVFFACNTVALLIRVQDRLEFSPVWNQSLKTEFYQNKKFPMNHEKL